MIDESEEPKSIKEITHLLLNNTMHFVPPGLYEYNPVTQILISLDDDMMGFFPIKDITNKATASSYKPYKHIPTWNKMIEDGVVKDNRTKKEDDIILESADMVKNIDAKDHVKRNLSF